MTRTQIFGAIVGLIAAVASVAGVAVKASIDQDHCDKYTRYYCMGEQRP